MKRKEKKIAKVEDRDIMHDASATSTLLFTMREKKKNVGHDKNHASCAAPFSYCFFLSISLWSQQKLWPGLESITLFSFTLTDHSPLIYERVEIIKSHHQGLRLDVWTWKGDWGGHGRLYTHTHRSRRRRRRATLHQHSLLFFFKEINTMLVAGSSLPLTCD